MPAVRADALSLVESMIMVTQSTCRRTSSANSRPLSRHNHGGEHRHVALIVETSRAPGRDMLRGIAEYVRGHTNWSLYCQPRDVVSAVPKWLQSWEGHGVIARVHSASIARALRDTGLPVVDVLDDCREADFQVVHVDDTAIARICAEHLLERGFRHFACCSVANTKWARNRCAGFCEVIRPSCADSVEVIELSRFVGNWESEQNRLGKWLVSAAKPLGVMACHDIIGQRVLEAAQRRGISVPDEVAVIGVDNDEPLCELCEPQLSSVVPCHRRVGYEAAALLDRMMRGEHVAGAPILLTSAQVIVRQSTDILAIPDSDIRAAIRYVRSNACTKITVDDIIKHTALSRSTLKRRFKQFVGRTVQEEILATRIKVAQELLSSTELSIAHVARRIGYEHQEQFGAAFKRLTGSTPKQYRIANMRSWS